MGLIVFFRRDSWGEIACALSLSTLILAYLYLNPSLFDLTRLGIIEEDFTIARSICNQENLVCRTGWSPLFFGLYVHLHMAVSFAVSIGLCLLKLASSLGLCLVEIMSKLIE